MTEQDEAASAERHGERLRRLRERLGLSQREMAAEFKVTSGAVALWETGSREMPGPALRLLELYEKESSGKSDSDESSEDERPIESSWFGRSLPPAAASLYFIMLGRFRVTEDTSPIAKRVRLAVARRFIRNAAELRGLASKMVQMVSYMDVLLSDSERAMCAEVEQERPPLSSTRVDRIFETELNGRPGKIFASWSARPLAVGSIGQVHEATLRSGERVVVKVQYPEIIEALQTDLGNIKLMEQCIALLFRSQRAGVLFDEMRARFLEECDYELEARHLRRFGELFAGRRDFEFPTPFPDYSSGRVLTMSRLTGVPFDTFARNATQEARNRASALLWTFQYESVLRHGLFNTDPHPGNLMFADDRLKVVDFGRVKELSPGFVGGLRSLFRSVLERDRDLFARALVEIGGIGDARRFDYDYAYRGIAFGCLPFMRDEPFTFTAPFVQRLWVLFSTENVNRPYSNIPADGIFFHQLAYGLSAVLARLRGRVSFRSLMLDLLYADGEPRPAPYSADEIRALGLDPALGAA